MQVITLRFAQIGALVFGKQCQQVQRHGFTVKVIDNTHTTRFSLRTPTPAKLAYTTRAFNEIASLGMSGKIADDVCTFVRIE